MGTGSESPEYEVSVIVPPVCEKLPDTLRVPVRLLPLIFKVPPVMETFPATFRASEPKLALVPIT